MNYDSLLIIATNIISLEAQEARTGLSRNQRITRD